MKLSPSKRDSSLPELSLAQDNNRKRKPKHVDDSGDLLARYVRRSACAAAAGAGAFGLTASGEAAINVVTPDNTFLQRSLVGNPYEPAPIESLANPGTFPFDSVRWATAGFDYQYSGTYYPTASFGIDIDGNGSGDINFFRGPGYAGYLIANSNIVGYTGGPVFGSGQVDILSNDTDNPQQGPPVAGANKQALQGFNADEVIGDGNDASLGTNEGVMRDAYRIGDWDGVNDNYENLYPNPGGSSYVGFQISGLDTGTGTGFGWIEVIVREGTVPGFQNPSHPELQIIRWAYTDDGSPITAGDTGQVPGDFDGNGIPGEPSDYAAWLANDGTIEGYNLYKSSIGTAGNGSSSGSVPEPSTLGLLAAGAGGLAIGWRKRRNS